MHTHTHTYAYICLSIDRYMIYIMQVLCSSSIRGCRARFKISSTPLAGSEEVGALDVSTGSLQESYSRAEECIGKVLCVRRRIHETWLQAALAQQRVHFPHLQGCPGPSPTQDGLFVNCNSQT